MRHNIISYLELDREFSRNNPPAVFNVLSDWKHELSGRVFYIMAVSFAEKLYESGIWNQPIVIRAEHRLETLALFLGAVLSGNYYVPLPKDLPEGKLQKILRKLHTQRVYTYDDVSVTADQSAEDVWDRLWEARERLPETAPLYVIFTSGSTGEPKGVVKSHKSMIAFLESYSEVFEFSQSDVLANQTPFCFDASAKDFYLMLKYRMDFHIVDEEMFRRPLNIVHLLNERKVTVIQWVPSALSMLSQLRAFDREKPLYLKKVFFVGETFPVKQLNYWQEHLADAMFVNLYGSSEMAGICCYFILPMFWQRDSIPLGKPLPKQRVYLLGEDGAITECGRVGEICIESNTLAEGYLVLENDGKESVEFVSCPFPTFAGGRYYRTGDLAKYDEEGNLCFVSRRDFQIKHMGHRVELGEIERVAENIDGVDRACAVYQGGKIILYYQGSVGKRQLQMCLKLHLQPYMMPRRIFFLEMLPLNQNGKVDRTALKQMQIS